MPVCQGHAVQRQQGHCLNLFTRLQAATPPRRRHRHTTSLSLRGPPTTLRRANGKPQRVGGCTAAPKVPNDRVDCGEICACWPGSDSGTRDDGSFLEGGLVVAKAMRAPCSSFHTRVYDQNLGAVAVDRAHTSCDFLSACLAG